MSRTREEQESEQAAPAVAEPVAGYDTMTIAGITFGEFSQKAGDQLADLREQAKVNDATIAELKAKVETLTAESAAKSATIADLNTDLAIARIVAEDAKKLAGGFQKLPDGSVRLVVTLDVDEATPLLSWAEGAGEEPGPYIATQIKDALVAVTSS
jgi:hypothetical protein